ncbi:MAG: two-component sensor histidine kinase [Hyphomicrobiales bacterium]|nr:MAG: two-component sensor histidine kinase [Hyphomicrobiales bacterium]
MTELAKALLPRRIAGQIVLLVFIAVLITALISAGLQYLERRDFDARAKQHFSMFLMLSAARLLSVTPEGNERAVIVDAMARSNPELNLRLTDEPLPDNINVADFPPFNFLARDLGPGFRLFSDNTDGKGPDAIHHVIIELPDESRVAATLHLFGPPPQPIVGIVQVLLFLAIVLPAILYWATSHLSRRLRTFADAAADYSVDGDHAPLEEDGPEEIRVAARALNRMRDRIAEFVEDRTRMLSSVGHDLRTPITRLRLRTEFIEDNDTREGMKRDLDRMNTMVESALTFLREGYRHEPPARLDLPTLLHTICDEFADLGKDVSYEGPDHLLVEGRTEDLQRAIENLIDNALKFGTHARISLTERDRRAVLAVDDNGPGIPAESRQSMQKPFVRGDDARQEATGGFGLGLSIVSSIARQHRGELELHASESGGLSARIKLPLAPK